MSAAHTPGPWYVSADGHIRDNANMEPIGTVDGRAAGADGDEYTDRGVANAAFIVRACNAHDELVAALRGIVDFADLPWDDARLLAARAALAKVTP